MADIIIFRCFWYPYKDFWCLQSQAAATGKMHSSVLPCLSKECWFLPNLALCWWQMYVFFLTGCGLWNDWQIGWLYDGTYYFQVSNAVNSSSWYIYCYLPQQHSISIDSSSIFKILEKKLCLKIFLINNILQKWSI